MAALHLVEEGKFTLDDNVNDYLIDWQVEDNEFTAKEKVTLRQILSHSAGLTVHGFAGYSSTDTLPGIIDVLNGRGHANSGRIFPDTVPGAIYRYSGGGYTVMQKMLCDITGKDFPVLMDEMVLGPLGMKSSTYIQPLPGKLEPLAAVAHIGDGTEVVGRWHTYPEMAAAGLWTTPTDLLKYAMEVQKSLMGKSNKVISKEMTEEMLTPQMDSHGLGPALDGKNASATFSHGGANMGYRCRLTAFVNGGQGVAIMTNSDNGDVLSGEILRAFSELYAWENYKQIIKEVVDLDDSLLKEFEGKYYLKIGDQELIFTLSKEDKHLKGLQLWDNGEFELYPESEILFFNITDRAPFEFERDSEGEVIGVIFREEYHFKRIGEME
jgi:CubicO group peptidase (beta-lactamase class C family)